MSRERMPDRGLVSSAIHVATPVPFVGAASAAIGMRRGLHVVVFVAEAVPTGGRRRCGGAVATYVAPTKGVEDLTDL